MAMKLFLHRRPVFSYGFALMAMLMLTLVNAIWAPWIGYWSVALVFLLGVMALACVLSLRPALFAAALSVVCWNIFFIPPVLNVQIRSVQDMLMCVTYFIVALIITGLTRRIRDQEERVKQREQRLSALYRFSERLVLATDRLSLLALAEEEIKTALAAHVQFLSQEEGQNALSGSEDLVKLLPLCTSAAHYGWVRAVRTEPWELGQQYLLDIFARHLALALEREALREVATQHELNRLSENLYDTLLDSVSHELRTPLTIIQCVLANLQQPDIMSQPHWRQESLTDLENASLRLDHLVANLLDMSRLQSGRVLLNQDWCDPMDIVHSALKSLEQERLRYPIEIIALSRLPLLYVDFTLLEQALVNLVHNALTHNAPETTIRISLGIEDERLLIEVADQGTGIPEMYLPFVFDKFYRSPDVQSPGTGLGLSITQGFVLAHGGEIKVSNASTGGACFSVYLPISPLPDMPVEVDDVPTYSHCG
jgi:two-component system, OmpR family, sensor histidine kinase KdpD